jgi:hypothetical protein
MCACAAGAEWRGVAVAEDEVRMRDIYALADDAALPEAPDEAHYLGALTLEDFRAMACFTRYCDEAGLGFRFFDDSRVTSKQVREMLAQAQACRASTGMRGNPEAYARLLHILQQAAERKLGMMAVAD